MTAVDWGKLLALVHFIGVACILALPIITVAILIVRPVSRGDLHVTARLALYVGRIHHVAIAGAGIALLTGLGLLVAYGIGPGELVSTQRSLLVKIVLFALLVGNGILLAGPAIYRRIEALQEATAQPVPTAEQSATLDRTATLLRATGMPQAVLLLGILILEVFKPF
jgi:hypothetical protein